MCGPPELRKFAEVLPGYKIVVVDASRNYHCYAYGEGEILLGLLFDTERYDALTLLPGFLGSQLLLRPLLPSVRPSGNQLGLCESPRARDLAFTDSRVGLFAEYVNTWLKIKQEASGWPASCITTEQRRAYVHAYEAREGNRLDVPHIELNPGPRKLAKTMNNSMWWKFGQQENKTQVVEFVEPQPFHTFLDSDQHDIRYVSSLTEERVDVHYKQKAHCETVSPNVNIFVAAFITCWARLRLYEALELLDKRVLYFDTDSIIFTHLPGQTSPPLRRLPGRFQERTRVGRCHSGILLRWTKELLGTRRAPVKTVCKVRGFSLNVQGREQLNYEILRDNILAELERPLAAPTRVAQLHTITRDAKGYTLHARPSHKDYRLVFSKRMLDPITAKTYPYGYERF